MVVKDVRDDTDKPKYQETDDRELIRLFSSGDRRAFDEFYKRYYSGLMRFVMSYCSDKSLAEDVVQDIFLKVMDFRIKLGLVSNIKSYLYSSALNRCRDMIRNQKNTVSFNREDINEKYSTIDKSDEKIETEIINNLIKSLPQMQREVLLLRTRSGLPFKDIAQILKISENSAKVNYFYAVTSLKKMIGEEKDE